MTQFSNLLDHTPIQNRTSCDRFLSPGRPPIPHRVSVTPDRDVHRRLSRISNVGFPPLPDKPMNSPRSSICRPLFQSQSQELFSAGRRKMSRTSSVGRESLGGSRENSPSANRRRLPSNPCRSIEVDNVSSDFYVTPMDWSRKNTIAFALQDQVLFINPKTLDITEPDNMPYNVVSLKFSPFGERIFLGDDSGTATMYDTLTCQVISEAELFESSVLVSDWKDNTVISGSREGQIAVIDVRDDALQFVQHTAHLEEVCSIKIHPDMTLLATCGNDCLVKIWDMRYLGKDPLITYSEHEAAIRACVWSPAANDIIVTGGGTADKRIKMWNTTTGETIKSVDTGSQVCNLYWNEEYNEIVSTHGFSQNHICLWKASDLSPVASFHTHRQRVLFMCASPDGTAIATAAPEDNLQIWNMWPQQNLSMSQSLLILR